MRADQVAKTFGSFFSLCAASRSGAIFSSPFSIDQQKTSFFPWKSEMHSFLPSSERKTIRSAVTVASGSRNPPGADASNFSASHLANCFTIAPFLTFIFRPMRGLGTTSSPLNFWLPGASPGVKEEGDAVSLATCTNWPFSPTTEASTETSTSLPCTSSILTTISPCESVLPFSTSLPSALTVTSTAASGPLASRTTMTTSSPACSRSPAFVPSSGGGSSWSCSTLTCDIMRSAVTG